MHRHVPIARGLAVFTLGVLAAMTAVTVQAQTAASPGTGQASPATSGAPVEAGPTLDPSAVATCRSFEVQPERCYLEGGATIHLQGGVRASAELPLEWGVNASSDVVPSISLHLGSPGAAEMVIDLPGVPGTSETPADGDSAGPGEAQVWWSLQDGGDASLAAYGHACTVSLEADEAGRLSGTIACPKERAGRARRYRADIRFEAIPLVSAPLPTPMPAPSVALLRVTDAPCALVDEASAASTLGLKRGSLLLLDAGPGQCVGIWHDQEAVFLSVRDGATSLELAGTGQFRGAACTALPMATLADASVGSACEWPDGRTMVAGNVLSGPVSLVVALSTEDRSPEQLLDGVTEMLSGALDRLP